jgi:hypothetical protein
MLIVSFSKTAGAAVTINNPLGYYQLTGGKLSVSVNFKNILTMNVSLPNIAILRSYLGGCFVFDYWYNDDGPIYWEDNGVFGMYFPIDFSTILPIELPITIPTDGPTWVGEWGLTGPGKFSILPVYQAEDGLYYTLTPSELADYINELLATQGGIISMITVTVPKYSFTGTQDLKKDTLKINFSLTININAIVTTGTITLSGTNLTTSRGTLEPPEPPPIIFSSNAAKQAGGILSIPRPSETASPNGLANWVVDIIKTLPLEDIVPAN